MRCKLLIFIHKNRIDVSRCTFSALRVSSEKKRHCCSKEERRYRVRVSAEGIDKGTMGGMVGSLPLSHLSHHHHSLSHTSPVPPLSRTFPSPSLPLPHLSSVSSLSDLPITITPSPTPLQSLLSLGPPHNPSSHALSLTP